MKRLFTLSVLFAALFTILATNNSAKAQPESFTENYLMENCRGNQVVNSRIVTVRWDATANKMYIDNFYVSDYAYYSPAPVMTLGVDQAIIVTWETNTHATFKWREHYYGEMQKDVFVYHKSRYSNPYKWFFGFISPASPNTGSSRYLSAFDGTQTEYGLSGGYHQGTIDLEEGIITMGAWGHFIREDRSGGHVGVVEWFEHSVMKRTNLVDIVNDGNVGNDYTVNDDLVGVKVVDNMLFAKDLGKYKYPSLLIEGQDDFMGRVEAKDMHEEKVHPAADYDQSNWVMLTGLNNPGDFVGYRINGKSIKGTLVDKVNPTIAVTSTPEQGDQHGYEPNLYIMPSFNEDYYAPTSNFFFVAPKAQEYAYITWACYNAADGNFYTMSDGNTSNLTGGVKVNWDYYPAGNPQDGYVYEFDAIVRKVASTTNGAPLLKDGNQSTPVTGVLSDDYMVYPLRLYDVPTAINSVEVACKVVNVKYYNLMGVESSTPFDGVNIVVTTYDNGSRITSKKLY